MTWLFVCLFVCFSSGGCFSSVSGRMERLWAGEGPVDIPGAILPSSGIPLFSVTPSLVSLEEGHGSEFGIIVGTP